jgi:uncharacterized protein Usg
MTVESHLHKQLQGYRLTTAEILYHLPDHPAVLQTYIWQELDIAPRFPVLQAFLDFWNREIEGKLHSVRVASAGLIQPARWGHAAHMMYLH